MRYFFINNSALSRAVYQMGEDYINSIHGFYDKSRDRFCFSVSMKDEHIQNLIKNLKKKTGKPNSNQDDVDGLGYLTNQLPRDVFNV